MCCNLLPCSVFPDRDVRCWLYAQGSCRELGNPALGLCIVSSRIIFELAGRGGRIRMAHHYLTCRFYTGTDKWTVKLKETVNMRYDVCSRL